MKLTNRSKQVSNKEMTLAERVYLPAIAKGMAITIKHMFQKPATIKYPEQKRERRRAAIAGVRPGRRVQSGPARNGRGNQRGGFGD